MAAAETEYPPSSSLFASPPSSVPDYPEATDPMFDTSGYIYSAPDDPSWHFLDYNTTSAYPGIDTTQLFTGSISSSSEPFGIDTETPGAGPLGAHSYLPMTYEPLPLMGGTDHRSPAVPNEPTYTPSSGARSDSGDSTRDENEPRFTCSQCRDSFRTYYTLESHARETAHRAYVCPEPGCKSQYYRRDSFVRHIKTHRESGLHVCMICERSKHRKTFKRKDHLRQHIQQLHPGHSVQDWSGKTASSRSSSTSSRSSLDAPSCRGGSATLGGDRLRAALAKDRGVKQEKLRADGSCHPVVSGP
ncbi:hypothetical protein B0A55_08718 [Friedmanniomyces simplex]|uniref:C2H2-type domain-containing protein n=1 Tax=Friedmanniomyces simplex TaxID=329884 RepID=A0A4V5NF43_9PEZI|nr:hypothetical protein B0A55_08718 [Friedmanniomyces simplex]